MRKVLAAGVVTAALAAPVGAALARPQTTKPGIVYTVTVILTDTRITLTHRAKGTLGLSRLPRGAIIRYEIVNRGSRPYVFRIWSSETAPIRPRKRDSILVNWNYRGRFVYKTIYRGKPFGPKGTVIVY
jgi:hypothetical protein